MPGFATSDITLKNAHALMQALEIRAEEIDIKPSCMQMFGSRPSIWQRRTGL